MHISSACVKDVKMFAVLAAAMLFVSAAPAALAQTTAPDVELPAVEAGALPSSPAGASAAGASSSSLPADPCPLPSDELSRAPDDLAKVQADIDRYTLCMERAQLLQRLNDVAMENQEKLNQSSGVNTGNPGMQLGGNTPTMEDIRAQIMGSIAGEQFGDAPAQTAPAPSEWTIIRVTGASGGLAAQLGKSDGTLARVMAGDSLPDGSQVNSVSATSVSITQDGERKELRWHQGDGV